MADTAFLLVYAAYVQNSGDPWEMVVHTASADVMHGSRILLRNVVENDRKLSLVS